MEEQNELLKMYGSEFKSETEAKIKELYCRQVETDKNLSGSVRWFIGIGISLAIIYVTSAINQSRYNERIKSGADMIEYKIDQLSQAVKVSSAEQKVCNDKQAVLNEKIIVHLAKEK